VTTGEPKQRKLNKTKKIEKKRKTKKRQKKREKKDFFPPTNSSYELALEYHAR
jgi:hypothetical protein